MSFIKRWLSRAKKKDDDVGKLPLSIAMNLQQIVTESYIKRMAATTTYQAQCIGDMINVLHRDGIDVILGLVDGDMDIKASDEINIILVNVRNRLPNGSVIITHRLNIETVGSDVRAIHSGNFKTISMVEGDLVADLSKMIPTVDGFDRLLTLYRSFTPKNPVTEPQGNVVPFTKPKDA